MKIRKSKKNNAEEFSFVQKEFQEYFNAYYGNHREVKHIDYRFMDNDLGYSAVIEYASFRQHINFFYDYCSVSKAVVNSAFEFSYNNKSFVCAFDDVLDMIDSDDLWFYTYANCFDTERLNTALGKIMTATQKYFSQLNNISSNNSLKKKYIEENYEYEDKDNEEFGNKSEFLFDITYVWNFKVLNTFQDYIEDYYAWLKKDLAKKFRKNELDTMYEKRAFRVLNNLSKADMKRLDRKLKNEEKISAKNKFLIYLPFIINALVFMVVFAVVGYKINMSVFENCVGSDNLSCAFSFAFAGIWISIIVSSLLPHSVYKLVVKKENYDSFIRMVNAQDIHDTTGMKVLKYGFLIVSCLAIALFFIFVFCFNGIAFSGDKIVYKEYAFSQKEVYSFEDTDIAIVKGSRDGNGYSEYTDTAYAFCLDGEWFEYGVPADEKSKELILYNIDKYNKDIKTYDDIVDLR